MITHTKVWRLQKSIHKVHSVPRKFELKLHGHQWNYHHHLIPAPFSRAVYYSFSTCALFSLCSVGFFAVFKHSITGFIWIFERWKCVYRSSSRFNWLLKERMRNDVREINIRARRRTAKQKWAEDEEKINNIDVRRFDASFGRPDSCRVLRAHFAHSSPSFELCSYAFCIQLLRPISFDFSHYYALFCALL